MIDSLNTMAQMLGLLTLNLIMSAVILGVLWVVWFFIVNTMEERHIRAKEIKRKIRYNDQLEKKRREWLEVVNCDEDLLRAVWTVCFRSMRQDWIDKETNFRVERLYRFLDESGDFER